MRNPDGDHEMTITDTIVTAVAPSRGYSSAARMFAFSSAFGLALGLSGCGSDTELNGKIFDLMGVSSAAQAASKSEPKMAARAGLVPVSFRHAGPKRGHGRLCGKAESRLSPGLSGQVVVQPKK